jgi:O-antigen ligase
MRSRAATVLVAAVAPAAILAVAPGLDRTGLDRFTAAKEIAVIALVALAAAAAALAWRGRLVVRGIDLALVAILAITAAGAATVAIDPGIAWRATAMTAAAIALFWAARGVEPRVVVAAVGGAAAIGAVAVIVEAFGLVSWSLEERGPGGTEGHRNFMAHGLAIGLPAAIAAAVTAARRWSRVLGAIAVAAVAAAITLSRSRTAWVAAVVGLIVLAAAAWRASDPGAARLRRAAAGIAVAAVLAGVVAAIVVPNRLAWASATPYLDTASTVAEFDTGSGRGRILQYRTTARMIAAHPWLGVGPAHWSVAYPAFARQPDSNHVPLAIEPVSKLANADWLPFAAERGIPAALLLVVAGGLVVLGCGRALRGRPEARVPAAVALAALAVAAVAGTFDSVLTRPTPLVFLAALVGAGVAGAPGGRTVSLERVVPAARIAAAAAIVALGVAGVARPALAVSAMYLNESPDLEDRVAAARRNPSAYEVDVGLALAFTKRRDCARAEAHARAALAHYPHHLLARRVIDRCKTIAHDDHPSAQP